MEATITFRPLPFSVATDDVKINGVVIEVDPVSGKAQGIRRVQIDEKQADMYQLDD